MLNSFRFKSHNYGLHKCDLYEIKRCIVDETNDIVLTAFAKI